MLQKNEQLIEEKNKELESILNDNENKKLSIDDIVTPSDVISNQ